MLSLAEIEEARQIVQGAMLPTPQYAWPLLAARTGCEVWVKHENHTPIGAFKVRGGLVYMDRLKRRAPRTRGVVSATRGNHGQSIALAAARLLTRPSREEDDVEIPDAQRDSRNDRGRPGPGGGGYGGPGGNRERFISREPPLGS